MVYSSETKTAGVRRVRGDSRIGPHNKDIISILYGSLLGEAHAENERKEKVLEFLFTKKIVIPNISYDYTLLLLV